MNERYRILLLSSQPEDDVSLVRKEIQCGCDVETMMLADPVPPGPWDAVLWDVALLGDTDSEQRAQDDAQHLASPAAVRDLLDRAGHPSLVLLSEDGRRADAQRAREMGSDDWIVRSRPWRLVSAIHRAHGDRLDLAHRKLLQAQKMELLGQLACGVAHDFNNIHTVVSGSAELLQTRLPKVDPLQRYADEIIRASRKAAALTRKLLTFGRQQDFKPAVVDLGDLVSDTEKMLRRLIGENVTLTTYRPAEPRLVRADAVQLEQVVLNLAVNARDAMPHGGRLEIRVDQRTVGAELEHLDVRAGPFITLEVTDSGHGMDAATRARIFEPFFTTKGTKGGTGLGLSTVYGIVRRCEGAIEVRTRPNAGTTFRVWLPESTDSQQPRPAPIPAIASPIGSGSILLDEHEPSVCRVLQRSLESSGYTVHSAGDGNDAQELLRRLPKNEIDVLVCDVVMPGISGPDLVRIVRDHSADMKVVLMSGYPETRFASLGVGDIFLHKPFTSERLASEIGNLLRPAERSVER